MRKHVADSVFSNVPSPSRRKHRSKTSSPSSPSHGPTHSLSKYALRMRAKGSVNHDAAESPPQPVLATILAHEHEGNPTNGIVASPDTESLRDSGYSEDGMSTVDLSHALDERTDPRTASPPTQHGPEPEHEHGLNNALANEAFKSIKAEQEQQFQRIALFESNQRKALASFHALALKRLSARLEASIAERVKHVSFR